MKLNNLELSTFNSKGNVVQFVIEKGFTLEQVLELDGQTLTVTSNDKPYAVFDGYVAVGVKYNESEQVIAEFMRELNDSTAEAIGALQTNFTTIRNSCDTLSSTVSEMNANFSAVDVVHDEAIGELGVSTAALLESNTQLAASDADVLQAIGELGAMVAEMQSASPATSPATEGSEA